MVHFRHHTFQMNDVDTVYCSMNMILHRRLPMVRCTKKVHKMSMNVTTTINLDKWIGPPGISCIPRTSDVAHYI